MTVRLDLSLANGQINNKLIKSAGKLAGNAFRALGDWRDSDIDRFLAQIAPGLSGVKLQAARQTVAFYKSMADLTGQDFTQPIITASDLTTKELRNGVGTSLVYQRPFVDMRTVLSKGGRMIDAIEAGAKRAQILAETDVQLARRNAGLKARSNNDRIVGYVRTLTGAENCALCYLASTQRYTRNELMPIHPGCDCGEMPIYGTQDPGQVINEVRLEAIHENVQTRFGVSDRGGREIDYRRITITEHGEMGPMLTVRGQKFTDQDNLVLTNTKTYTSIDNLVEDAQNLQEQIDSIYDYKKGREGNGNVSMQVLMEQSGKGGKPDTVATEADLPEGTVYYRGVSVENADGFINNERHRIGLGVYGDGYYFASDKNVADGYAKMGDSPGKTIAAVLKPDAKILKWDGFVSGIANGDAIADIQESAAEALNYYVGDKLPSEAEEIIADNFFGNYQDAFTTDLILKGYDGIELPQPGAKDGSTYLVLFNRGAVTVANQ